MFLWLTQANVEANIIECEKGYYQAQTTIRGVMIAPCETRHCLRETECRPCPSGKYSDSLGQTACKDCHFPNCTSGRIASQTCHTCKLPNYSCLKYDDLGCIELFCNCLE